MNIHELFSHVQATAGGPSVQRAAQRLPLAVSCVSVVLLGYYLARLLWALLPVAPSAPWQPPPPLASAASAPLPAQDYSGIAAAHLFGEASTEAPAADGDAALNAPDTSLSLQLRGAIAADDPRFAHAIIADGSGIEQVYFVNGTLPGGATVQRIEAGLVVLARGGQLEVLRLPREGQGGAPRPMSAASLVSSAPPSVQEVVAQNAAGFLEVVRPQPFMPNGQLKGYRIYPGPNRQQFAALGLRAGDLVTEINGVTLNNPAQGMEVFRSLGDAPQVTVTVERDGQPQVLSLNLTQINAIGATQ